MPLVDQLATVLPDLTVGELAADRPAAPTDPVGSLVHRRDAAGLPEAMCSRQSRKPSADDDHAGRLSRFRRRCESTECPDSERQSARVAQQLAPGRPALLEHLVDLDSARERLPGDGCRRAELLSKSRSSHLAPL